MCLQNLAQIYLQGFWMFPYLTQDGWRFEIQGQHKPDVCYIFGTPFVPLECILLVDTTVRQWNVAASEESISTNISKAIWKHDLGVLQLFSMNITAH